MKPRTIETIRPPGTQATGHTGYRAHRPPRTQATAHIASDGLADGTAHRGDHDEIQKCWNRQRHRASSSAASSRRLSLITRETGCESDLSVLELGGPGSPGPGSLRSGGALAGLPSRHGTALFGLAFGLLLISLELQRTVTREDADQLLTLPLKLLQPSALFLSCHGRPPIDVSRSTKLGFRLVL